jgi:hypothetical protein
MRPNYPLPTALQQQAICGLFVKAFIELRSLSRSGKQDRIFDLTDLFHNAPREMYRAGIWDPLTFRFSLENYQRKYSSDTDGPPFDYLGLFDKAFGRELAPWIQLKEHLESLSPICSGVWQRGRSPRLNIRIVQNQMPRTKENTEASQCQMSEPSEGFYQLISTQKESRSSAQMERFATLREAVEHCESMFGDDPVWDFVPPFQS